MIEEGDSLSRAQLHPGRLIDRLAPNENDRRRVDLVKPDFSSSSVATARSRRHPADSAAGTPPVARHRGALRPARWREAVAPEKVGKLLRPRRRRRSSH